MFTREYIVATISWRCLIWGLVAAIWLHAVIGPRNFDSKCPITYILEILLRDYTKLVQSLPLHPDKLIIWIVYNEDMLEYVRSQIAEIKGYDYVLENVRVVTRKDASKYSGHIYFDPNLMDQIGCGYD